MRSGVFLRVGRLTQNITLFYLLGLTIVFRVFCVGRHYQPGKGLEAQPCFSKMIRYKGLFPKETHKVKQKGHTHILVIKIPHLPQELAHTILVRVRIDIYNNV